MKEMKSGLVEISGGWHSEGLQHKIIKRQNKLINFKIVIQKIKKGMHCLLVLNVSFKRSKFHSALIIRGESGQNLTCTGDILIEHSVLDRNVFL